VLIHSVMIAGGVAMLCVRHYGLARASAVVTIAFLGGACAIGLPFGMWALIQLSNPRVRSAFAAGGSHHYAA
jgi:hypothetical protein